MRGSDWNSANERGNRSSAGDESHFVIFEAREIKLILQRNTRPLERDHG